MIRVATKKDIPAIEEILYDAVVWMNLNHISNLWTQDNIKWDFLSKSYRVQDFYIDFIDHKPAGCMALTDIDQTYWPTVPKGSSLYLHKLAVKREFRGMGISKQLMDYMKEKADSQQINTLRLDCNAHRKKLRALYESQGFKCVDIISHNGYELALYAAYLSIN